MKKGRKIKLIKWQGKDYIFINRGKNNFLFTSKELNIAKERFERWKNEI